MNIDDILKNAEKRALKLACEGKLLREMDLRMILREEIRGQLNEKGEKNDGKRA